MRAILQDKDLKRVLMLPRCEIMRWLFKMIARFKLTAYQHNPLLKQGGNVLWSTLASGIETQSQVKKFFNRRMEDSIDCPKLTFVSAAPNINDESLRNFKSAGGFSRCPGKAKREQRDTFLFHGTPQIAVGNIALGGLDKRFAKATGMLGAGIYGAPDPRKSAHYAKNADGGQDEYKFMFICRFNMRNATHAGPGTGHRNTMFHEYMVPENSDVVVLWMLKFK